MTAKALNRVIWNGTEYDIRLSAEQSGGRLGIFASVCPPESGPPRHVHLHEDETFYLLSGEVRFWMDGTERVAQAGECVFVPRGREHAFRVIGPRPARMLTIMTPGGFEGFFVEMARDQLRLSQDADRIFAIAKRYELEFTGPPMDAERP